MTTAPDPQKTLLFDSHMHTPLCKHAVGMPEEYAAAAFRRGFHGMVITCHSPMPDRFSARVRMAPEELDTYLSMVQEAADQWQGRVEILLGMESDYFPGMEPWLRELHSRADFHYILGSVHPHLREYREAFGSSGDREYQENYFRHLADAAETGLFDTLAHPDLVKNFAANWDLGAMMEPIRAALDRIAATGVALELNTSGANKAVPEMNPAPAILEEIAARGIPIVLGSDAHVPERVGDRFLEAMHLLKRTGFRSISRFRQRKRIEIPLDDAIGALSAVATHEEEAASLPLSAPHSAS
ncbi:MAG TPA: histidinol-phosphatase [Chthoniobacteraceae bacterium]|nr:histidinol-phosphatase [Chthoniobacteraceae bacterium]